MRLVLVIAAGVLAWAIALMVSRHAARLGLVATVNDRSSHKKPTPTGGGIGLFAAATLAGGRLLFEDGSGIGWPILVAGIVMGLLGLADDLRNLGIRVRIGVHALVVIGLIYAAGQPGWVSEAGVAAIGAYCVAMFVAGVWWINLFNFMDGIDGIAGSEGAFICLAAAGLAWLGLPDVMNQPQWWMLLAVAAAALGFLTLNWPPARIFMGDAGSNFLAAAIFGLMLYSVAAGWLSLAAWLILPAAFVADATVTLARRMLTRQRFLDAHRSHAYQRLSRQWGGHQPVTLLYIGVNIVWLLPLAWLAQTFPAFDIPAVIIAYLPLLFAAHRLGAGLLDQPASA